MALRSNGGAGGIDFESESSVFQGEHSPDNPYLTNDPVRGRGNHEEEIGSSKPFLRSAGPV